MRHLKSFTCALLVAFVLPVWAQDDAIKAVKDRYDATFAAMHSATSKADLQKMVDAMDAPEWIGVAPTGETIDRPEALRLLEALLTVPPQNRPLPQQQFIYITNAGAHVLALYWVYRQSGRDLIGSMVRDTWDHTGQGWRRIKHEKLFPDRPLVENGRPVLLPGLTDSTQQNAQNH